MKIQVRKNGRLPTELRFPTGLVLNPMAMLLLPGVLGTHNISISKQQTAQLIHALNTYRKMHKDWILAEVECADGDYILIKL